uniref:Protein RER1 n=2 Tax=Neobodo designis TaxID=312471 RepID=A0A7S1QI52_NEODS|mmetsp:Transcript_45701/g.140843  ORF Transcript_45701/g.140843 Transcript_45701/m.140843 type:complete len:185 (+) Transcript_45701:44-598(+)
MSDAPTAFARPQNKLLAAVRPAQITFQKLLDRSVPHTLGRWIGFACLLLLYILRVALHGGFYVVTYGMCVHLLYLLVLFLTPLDAPADDDADADAVLASKAGDEFKPYVPKVQEFKVWYGMMRVVCIAFACTLFEVLDIPVFWPILLIYFVGLFMAQMSARIKHMIKFKYVPWDRKKPRYVSKE